jgi:hypothetical protein
MSTRARTAPKATTRGDIRPGDLLDFWNNITVGEEFGDDCWEWQGLRNRAGYGVWGVGRRCFGTGHAHRCSYTLFVGVVPDGLHLDHLCRNPACVRPDHLEPVTPAENMRRKPSYTDPVLGPPIPRHITAAIKRAERTHFDKCGHPYTPENLYEHGENGKYRFCRTCKLARNRARRAQASTA